MACASLVGHARRYTIQLSCSARHHPRLFCWIQVEEGHPLAVAAALGGQTQGVRAAVAFIESPVDFYCPNRLLKNSCGGPSAVLRGVGSGRFTSHRLRRCEPSPNEVLA